MGKIIGLVNDVRHGQPSERFPVPTSFVTLETFSFMMTAGVVPPRVGDTIEADFRVQFRDGKAPLRWLGLWQKVDVSAPVSASASAPPVSVRK